MDQKACLNLVKKDQLCAVALMNRKWILRVLLKMVAMAISHSLWRFYLIALTPTTPALLQNKIWLSKQAYLVGFCFVLFNILNFWQLVLVFSALYKIYLEITLFCTKPSEQIVYCHVTDVKMLKNFSLLNNDTIGLWLPQISGIYL